MQPVVPTPQQTRSAPPDGRSVERPGFHPTAVLVIICVSYFMVILDNSIIFTGLPSIEAGMDLSATGLAWVQDAYVLAFGGLLLLGARAGDLLGRRRMFVVGLVVFAVASLLVGAAQTPAWLIGARALQGLGAAILAPTSLSLLTASFPEGRERTRAVAAYSAVAGIGASLGLVVGGLTAELISWRAGFFLNVPISVLMVLAAPRFLLETPPRRGRFDLPGAVLATVGSSALVFGIIEAGVRGWGDPVTLAAIVGGLVGLGLLVVNEGRAEQPIMPLRLFASRARTGAYLARALYLGAMVTFFFYTTQFLQGVLGFGPLEAGLAFLPMTAVNFAFALAIPRLTGRFGNTTLLVAGVVLTLVGMGWLSVVDAGSAYLTGVALPMVLIGAGQGLAFAPLTAFGIAGVASEDAGAASGLVNTVHQLGTALGLGLATALAVAAAPGATTPAVIVSRVGTALTTGSFLLALCLAAVLALVVPAARLARTARAGEHA